jgi:hypothetical protein
MHKESLLEYTRRIALDERTILNGLSESSQEFHRFYVGERDGIIDFIQEQGGYDTPEKVSRIYRDLIQNFLGMELFMSC